MWPTVKFRFRCRFRFRFRCSRRKNSRRIGKERRQNQLGGTGDKTVSRIAKLRPPATCAADSKLNRRAIIRSSWTFPNMWFYQLTSGTSVSVSITVQRRRPDLHLFQKLWKKLVNPNWILRPILFFIKKKKKTLILTEIVQLQY